LVEEKANYSSPSLEIGIEGSVIPYLGRVRKTLRQIPDQAATRAGDVGGGTKTIERIQGLGKKYTGFWG